MMIRPRNILPVIAILSAAITGNPVIMSLTALALFPLRARSCHGLLFVAGGALVMACLAGLSSASIFFLRSSLLALAASFVSLRSRLLEGIIADMHAIRREMKSRTVTMNMEWIRRQFPILPARRAHPLAETFVWSILLIPLLAAFAPSHPLSAPEEFILESPDGTRILTEGRHELGRSGGRITVDISRTGARVLAAECPQQRCLHQGSIEAGSGRSIICMPNRFVIRSRRKAKVDGWTG
ncbi:MAG: NusG domain II-containing protein [Candidatus Hydrogenedentota bacterium]